MKPPFDLTVEVFLCGQMMSVSVSLSSSVSDEKSNQQAQTRTLLDQQKEQILAECQARINRHEFQAAYDRRRLLKLVKLLNLNDKNFIALELNRLNREIISFFKGQ